MALGLLLFTGSMVFWDGLVLRLGGKSGLFFPMTDRVWSTLFKFEWSVSFRRTLMKFGLMD